VLEDCAPIAREPDLFRQGRSTYQVTEPLITFYEAIMRPEWFRLESGQACYSAAGFHDDLRAAPGIPSRLDHPGRSLRVNARLSQLT